MKFWNNLSIQIKSLIAPMLGCIMALIIGGVFYAAFGSIAEARQQSKNISTVVTALNETILLFSKAEIKINNAITMKYFGADDKTVVQTMEDAKKATEETKNSLDKMDWNAANVDSATSKTFWKILRYLPTAIKAWPRFLLSMFRCPACI